MSGGTHRDVADGGDGAVVLVDVEAVDGPVGVGEGGRVHLHVVLAGAGHGGAVAAAGPGLPGPVAAEVGVEDLGEGLSGGWGVGGGGGGQDGGLTICMFAKWLWMLQSPWYWATGTFHEAGLGIPASRSEGVVPRGKNQMLMSLLVHSKTKTPPPLALKF